MASDNDPTPPSGVQGNDDEETLDPNTGRPVGAEPGTGVHFDNIEPPRPAQPPDQGGARRPRWTDNPDAPGGRNAASRPRASTPPPTHRTVLQGGDAGGDPAAGPATTRMPPVTGGVLGPLRGRGETMNFGSHPDGWDPAKGAPSGRRATTGGNGTPPPRTAVATDDEDPNDPHDPDDWVMDRRAGVHVQDDGIGRDDRQFWGSDRTGGGRSNRSLLLVVLIIVLFMGSCAYIVNGKINGSNLSDEDVERIIEEYKESERQGTQPPNNNGSTTIPFTQATTATTQAPGAPTQVPQLPGSPTTVVQTTTTVASLTTLPPTIFDPSITPKFEGEFRCNSVGETPKATLYIWRIAGTSEVDTVRSEPENYSVHFPDAAGNVSVKVTVFWRFVRADGQVAGGTQTFTVERSGCK